jgi:replicative DNA helicase
MMETAQKNNFNVAYYSPEMQSAYLGTRFDTWRTHISNKEIYRGKYSDAYKNYITSLKGEEASAFVIEDKDMYDGVSARKLDPFIKKHKIKLLIIDGLSYMTDDKPSVRDVEKFKHICADLFNISKKYGCAVVVTVQANRETKESKDDKGDPFPTIYNIEGSDHPARIATQVFAMRQIFDKHILDVRLEKSRNASNQRPTFSYLWDINRGSVQYVPNAEDQAVGSVTPVISSNIVDPNAAPVYNSAAEAPSETWDEDVDF